MKMTVALTALAAAFMVAAPMAVQAQDADDVEEAAPKKKAKKAAKAPAPVQKMFVAVSKFENKSGAAASDVDTLRDRITSLIVNTRKFDVVERENIQKLMKEQNLAAQGVTDAEDAPAQGKMKAAGYIFYGTVLSYGKDEDRANLGEAGSSAKYQAKIEIEVRLANAETGKILSSQVVQSIAATRQVNAAGTSSVGNKHQQAARDALATVSREATFFLLDQAYPVKVLSVGDEDITVNVNRSLVLEDELFDVYEAPTYEEDEDTHEMIPVDGKRIGRVAITEVGAKTSKAEPVDWVKVRGKTGRPQKACDLNSIEKGMVLRKVSAKTLAKEKEFLKKQKTDAFESRF